MTPASKYFKTFLLNCKSITSRIISMEHLTSMQVDKSWLKEYDYYLQHFPQEHRTKETSDIGLARPGQISDSHTSALTNLFNVVKAKRPIQNIYKRPI